METALAVAGVLFILTGLLGCFLPVLPGPPLAYVALLLLQIGPNVPFSWRFMILAAALVIIVTVLDYLVPAWGTQRWGGSRYGIIGAFAGVLAGLFIFPPFGFLIFPIVGAMIGEILYGANTNKAFKSAIGTFFGMVFGIVIKLSVTVYIAYHFVKNIGS